MSIPREFTEAKERPAEFIEIPESATLRDQFAMAALAAIISRSDLVEVVGKLSLPDVAYKLANDMMEARKR